MDINRARHCWESMQMALREQLGEAKYYWFKNLTVYSAEKSLLIFTHPDQFTAQHVQKIYGQTLLLSATAYFGMEFDDVAVVTPSEAEIIITKVRENNLNPHYTFENFIVGASNRLAYAAALAVSENPGKEYNPLFIYGGAGLGKTHLITAIANSIRNNLPDCVIEFSNSEKFTNEVVDAIREKRTGEFKARMRRVDVLFVDDVQFLANRVATQVEFFNTFNELYLAEKQIVITSDRPPDEISALEERMRSRFKSGVVADISRPDFETRLAILSLKCQNANIPCEMEALNLIAERVDSNIRELEGALSNCQLLASVEKSPLITVSIAKQAIKDFAHEHTSAPISARRIIDEVAAYFGVRSSDILSGKRSREVTVPRQMAIYLSREICYLSTTRLGEEFGRDHTTVMHSLKKAEEMIRDSRDFSQAAEELKQRLK
ncbi:MAG: chromosomal replication initiator protein DnaA [Clostridiales bacterium]|nr:chromosomal replication initiator protein DnaA [Clostridiales bacterium]